MTTIGIVGYMGSGKSYVSEIFEEIGMPVYNSDNKAKELMNKSFELKKELMREFGVDIYDQFGNWNRNLAVELAKTDSTVLDRMGAIIEPFLMRNFVAFKREKNNYLVGIECAILAKSKLLDEVDQIVIVRASDEIRMERIKKRDPFRSDREIKMLLDNQKSNNETYSFGDKPVHVLDNNGDDIEGIVIKIFSDALDKEKDIPH